MNTDIIEEIIRLKFLDRDASPTHGVRQTVGEWKKEIDAYRVELLKKSPEELQAIHKEEQKARQAKAELEDRWRFFNQPNAKADLAHWAKMTYWRLDEAIALAFGKDPKVVTWDHVKEYIHLSPFAKKYERARELALRAKNWKQLYDPVLPSLFLAWAKRNEIEVTPELVKEVEARGVVIADWKDYYDKQKDLYDKLKAQFDEHLATTQKLLATKDEQIAKLTQERDALSKRAAELESLVWEGFDEDSEIYPPELDIAMQAWRAATNRRDPSKTAKEQIRACLDELYPRLSEEAKQRIAVVCNWEKEGGRRRRD